MDNFSRDETEACTAAPEHDLGFAFGHADCAAHCWENETCRERTMIWDLGVESWLSRVRHCLEQGHQREGGCWSVDGQHVARLEEHCQRGRPAQDGTSGRGEGLGVMRCSNC